MQDPPHRQRRPFSEAEDTRLIQLKQACPGAAWNEIAQFIPSRKARQCRERYENYLIPTRRNDPFTDAEDRLLWDLYHRMGPQWVAIARAFQGRTGSDVKNRWHSHLKHLSPRHAVPYPMSAVPNLTGPLPVPVLAGLRPPAPVPNVGDIHDPNRNALIGGEILQDDYGTWVEDFRVWALDQDDVGQGFAAVLTDAHSP